MLPTPPQGSGGEDTHSQLVHSFHLCGCVKKRTCVCFWLSEGRGNLSVEGEMNGYPVINKARNLAVGRLLGGSEITAQPCLLGTKELKIPEM